MSFSYTDDAVVSTSPTGRHLSTVIKRPCVLMSGWTEHAEAICKVLNDLQPDHPVSNVKVELDFTAVEQRCADHYIKSADVLGMNWPRQAYINELLAQVPCPQRRSTDEANATQASGIFVAQDGTVRAETKQRGVHWRGKIPADKTLALLSWAGKGPHTVEQVRQKCEELATEKVEPRPVSPASLKEWMDYGLRIHAYAVEQGTEHQRQVSHLQRKVEELTAALKAPIEISEATVRSLLYTTPGVVIYSVGNTRPPLKRV